MGPACRRNSGHVLSACRGRTGRDVDWPPISSRLVVRAQAVEQEREVVGYFADLLIERLADAVTSRLHPEEDRLGGRGRGLESRGHLLGVVCLDPWVELTRDEQHGWVG